VPDDGRVDQQVERFGGEDAESRHGEPEDGPQRRLLVHGYSR
jgi:hypothetical protein